jgi:hypothetical protein
MVVRMDQGLLDRVRAAAALATRTPTNFVLRLIQEGVPMPAPPAPQESGSRPESGESGHGAGSGVQGRSLGR